VSGAESLVLAQASKWYGSVLALNQATLTLAAPITGLIGPNGSGKSTLIKLATGLIAPTLGTVTVYGVPANHWSANRLVGYCPDHDAFSEDLSGAQFIREMAGLCGLNRADAAMRAEATLRQVGMIDRADRAIRGYSKGMRQRIKLAQALLHEPRLLVLDEPLSGIDPVGRRELSLLFEQLAASGVQLLLSSHELEAIEQVCGHVAIMTRGRLVATGTLAQIREQLDHRPQAIRIDSPQQAELGRVLLALPGLLSLELHDGGAVVRLTSRREFETHFQRAVIAANIAICRYEPLDDSAHAVLGYVLGGSGKT